MKSKIKILFLLIIMFSFSSLNAEVKSINIKQLEKLKSIGIKIIDIRHPSDIKKTGIIPPSYTLGFYNKEGKIKKDRWLHYFVKLVHNRSIKFVLISSDGKQAKDVASLLKEEKGYKNPYYLEGGINNWINSNKKTISAKRKL